MAVVAGEIFGRLTVIGLGGRIPNGKKTAQGVIVQCSCGSPEFQVNINNLRSGKSKSCGCAKREASARTAQSQKGKSKDEIRSTGRESNLVGKCFGKLTAIQDLGIVDNYRTYLCVCDCGTEKPVKAHLLLRDNGTRSCGCLQRSVVTKHGMEGTYVYKCWQSMKSRCNDPRNTEYQHYGGRGISVCESWNNSFSNFLSDMGEPPTASHTLDRRDFNGNYCKDNCRWATRTEQNRNTRRNLYLTLNGETKTAAEWAEITGICAATIGQRKKRGWSDEDTLTTPIDKRFVSR